MAFTLDMITRTFTDINIYDTPLYSHHQHLKKNQTLEEKNLESTMLHEYWEREIEWKKELHIIDPALMHKKHLLKLSRFFFSCFFYFHIKSNDENNNTWQSMMNTPDESMIKLNFIELLQI